MDPFSLEVWTLYAVSVLVIFTRIFARWKMVGFKQFKPDDYLMLLAAVIYGCETTAGYSVGALYRGLANNNLTDEERAAIVPGSQEWNWRVGGSKIQVMGWSLWTGVLWILKICMTIFYSRLTNGLYMVRYRVWLGYFLVGASFMVVLLAILLGCRPFHKNWQIYPDPGVYCYPAVTPINNFTAFTMNVSTDLYLMSIPVPLLWRSNLSPRRKFLLITMFCGGVFIIMCSTIRVYLLVVAPVTGAQAAGIWGCRETFVAVVIGNVPMIYPFSVYIIRKAKTMTSSNGFSRSGGSAGGIELRGPSKPMRRKDNPLSIPGLTTLDAGESEERINRTPLDKEEHGVGISVVTEVSSTSHRESHSPTYSNASDGSPKNFERPHEYRPYSAPTYEVKVMGGDCNGNAPRLKGDDTWSSKRSG